MEGVEQVGISFDLVGLKRLVTALDCGEYHYRNNIFIKKKLLDTQLKVTILEKIVSQEELKNKILSSENVRVSDLYKIENKKRYEAENKSNWLPWVIAASTTVVSLTLGTVVYFKVD